MVLGSSITFGWGVEWEDVFTTRVEERLNRSKTKNFHVVNAGIGNYNAEFQYERFKRQYEAIDPDFVVLHYFINDAESNPTETDSILLKESYLAAFVYDRLMRIPGIGPTKDLVSYYGDLYKDDSTRWVRTQKIVKSMSDHLAKKDIKMVVLVIPDFHDLSSQSPLVPVYQKITDSFNKLGIEAVNTFSDFNSKFAGREIELWVADDDAHPNSKGHAIMAKQLLKAIEKQNL